MNRARFTVCAGASSGLLLGILLAFQSSAQGQAGAARPSGAGGAGNAAAGMERGWPRAEAQSPSRLPQDKAFGAKGESASAHKAPHAPAASNEEGCERAEKAIAEAGTGGATGSGQGGDAGSKGRDKAAEAVCSGGETEAPAGHENAKTPQNSDGASQAKKPSEEKRSQ